MAYRFFVFKEKTILTILKVLSLILLGVTCFFVYTKQTKYYIALIIANLVLIVVNFMLSKVTDSNVENALRIKGNFILDGSNNGYMVKTFAKVFLKAVIITVIIGVTIAFIPIDLRQRILTLNKYDGFIYLFIFICFYNIFNICAFLSNLTLKRKQNKIFDALRIGRIGNNIKEIKNIVIQEDRIFGIYLDKPTELLFDENSPSFKYLVQSIQRNEELKEEPLSRDNIYGGYNHDDSPNNF